MMKQWAILFVALAGCRVGVDAETRQTVDRLGDRIAEAAELVDPVAIKLVLKQNTELRAQVEALKSLIDQANDSRLVRTRQLRLELECATNTDTAVWHAAIEVVNVSRPDLPKKKVLDVSCSTKTDGKTHQINLLPSNFGAGRLHLTFRLDSPRSSNFHLEVAVTDLEANKPIFRQQAYATSPDSWSEVTLPDGSKLARAIIETEVWLLHTPDLKVGAAESR